MSIGAKKLSIEACSVCLEHVSDASERSIAKLKCGHHFHLDCIGSAFNAKGSMQCPNCRHVEDGRWLYATGSRAHEDINISPLSDDYTMNDDIYERLDEFFSRPPPEFQFGHLQWCPFFVRLQEVEPPASQYPEAEMVIDERVCPYMVTHNSQVIVLEDVPGGNGNGMRGGSQSYAVYPAHERSSWASQSGAPPPPPPAVGTMNDLGLASLPTDRFRWYPPANRSDSNHSGQQRATENRHIGTSQAPFCPHHGWRTISRPRSPRHSNRRSRNRGYANPSTSTSSRPWLEMPYNTQEYPRNPPQEYARPVPEYMRPLPEFTEHPPEYSYWEHTSELPWWLTPAREENRELSGFSYYGNPNEGRYYGTGFQGYNPGYAPEYPPPPAEFR